MRLHAVAKESRDGAEVSKWKIGKEREIGIAGNGRVDSGPGDGWHGAIVASGATFYWLCTTCNDL